MGPPEIKSTEITISVSHLGIISEVFNFFIYIDVPFVVHKLLFGGPGKGQTSEELIKSFRLEFYEE